MSVTLQHCALISRNDGISVDFALSIFFHYRKNKAKTITEVTTNFSDQWSCVYRVSATETVESDSIPSKFKSKTIRIHIHIVPA